MSDILQITQTAVYRYFHTMECIVPLEADVLAAFPAEVQIPARLVADSVAASSEASPRVLVVLDDDPTGTQSVANLPVLTRWEVADFAWAFAHEVDGQHQRAVYVLTNTRSLDPAEAAARNEEIVRNALAAAASAEPAGRGFGSASSAAATPPSVATTRSNRTSSPPPSPPSTARRRTAS